MADVQPGLSLGSFRLLPEAGLSLTHDDNIYAEPDGETSDLVTTTSIAAEVRSQWERHTLNLEAGLDDDRYADHSRENVTDYWFGGDGVLDVADRSSVFGGVRYSFDHEDRAEADALSPFVASEPTLYEQLESHLGVAYKRDRVSLRLGGTFTRMDYRDVDSVLGPDINMDDRDRDMSSIGARISIVMQPGISLFTQFATDYRRYEADADDAGFRRDSDGYRAAVGMAWTGRSGLRAEAFTGVMQQEFDDERFHTVSQPYFGLDLSWRMRPDLLLTGFVDRNLEESTIPEVAAYLDTTYGMRAEHQMTSRLSVGAYMAYTDSRFQGIDRTDRLIDAGVSARYFLTRNFYLSGEYRLMNRDSNEDEANYVRNQFLLGLGLMPGNPREDRGPAFSEDYSGSASGFAGIYAGAALGAGTLNTITRGARGSGTDTGSMADAGWSGSVYVGLGFFPVERWYLGIEAEADVTNVDWYHSKAKDDARTATTERTDSYGAALRIGRILDTGTLFYVRGGVARAHFDTAYAQNDPAVSASGYDDTDAIDGWRFGVGADIPLSGRAFVRLDYSYTDYQTLDVPYLTTSGPEMETFDSREGVFHLGLGMRLGAGGMTPKPASPNIRSGFYAGLQGGHVMPTSRLEGVHRDGSPTTHVFVGDFGGDGGAIGVFAGYGRVFRQFYAGIELEADSVQAKWRHDRETTGGGGRDFSVDQRFAYGASLRAGYLVEGNTLFYLRAGPVFGRFRTQWNKGNNPDAYVDRTDHLTGLRLGVGSEFTLTRNAFLRLDFTHTEYESYRFVTIHGGGANADEMKFDNAESLFRLGLGVRF